MGEIIENSDFSKYIEQNKSFVNIRFDDLFRFLERYSESYIDDNSDDGEETDAQMIARCLPLLKKTLQELEHDKLELNSKIYELSEINTALENKMKLYQDFLAETVNGDLSSDIEERFRQRIENVYNAGIKEGRESVNPNFKYCITTVDMDEVGLTDDIGKAMVEAAKRSSGRKEWRIYRISKASDGWRTYQEGYCEDGHYYDYKDGREFLHFDYIAQSAEKIFKI